jgi:hypothetical protein
MQTFILLSLRSGAGRSQVYLKARWRREIRCSDVFSSFCRWFVSPEGQRQLWATDGTKRASIFAGQAR